MDIAVIRSPHCSQNPDVEREGICFIPVSQVAGTSHIAGIDEIVARLHVGDALKLVRDEGNFFDEWAIRVMTSDNERLGYVTCEHNEIIARLLDGGKCVSARLGKTPESGSWTKIEMAVYLND